MLCDREAAEKVSIWSLVFNLNLMENTFGLLWRSHRQPQTAGRAKVMVQAVRLVEHYPFQARV